MDFDRPKMISADQIASRRPSLNMLLAAAVFALLTLPAAAQQQGPIGPPQASGGSSGTTNSAGPLPVERSASHGDSAITNEPPSLPVDQIIQRFSQHESEFRKERENYTYTQTFVMQTIDFNGMPDGEYRLTTDIGFTA